MFRKLDNFYIILSYIIVIPCTIMSVTSSQLRYSRYPIDRQTGDYNEGYLPSNLPSPPDGGGGIKTQPTNTLGFNNPMTFNLDGIGQDIYGRKPVLHPQGFYNMETPETTTMPPEGEEPEPEDPPAPFGFEETILILVPQFKFKINGFPKWCGASVKISFPLTIFFDELSWPQGPPPIPGSTTFISSLFSHGPAGPFGSVPFLRRMESLLHKKIGKRKSRSILSLPPTDPTASGKENSLRGGERATLFPKLEKTLLSTFGLGTGDNGRPCMLRAVCEIHEAKIHQSYGFFGEILTQFFSISNSNYAETHLPQYVEAEKYGREGNCSAYYKTCKHSLFYSNEELRDLKEDQSYCNSKDCESQYEEDHKDEDQYF